MCRQRIWQSAALGKDKDRNALSLSEVNELVWMYRRHCVNAIHRRKTKTILFTKRIMFITLLVGDCSFCDNFVPKKNENKLTNYANWTARIHFDASLSVWVSREPVYHSLLCNRVQRWRRWRAEEMNSADCVRMPHWIWMPRHIFDLAVFQYAHDTLGSALVVFEYQFVHLSSSDEGTHAVTFGHRVNGIYISS